MVLHGQLLVGADDPDHSGLWISCSTKLCWTGENNICSERKRKNPLFLQHLIKFLFGSLYASNITSASKINWISCLRKMNIYQKCCTLNFHQSYFPLLQVIGGFCALIGVFILALPVPIVVNRSDNSLEPPTLSPELVSNDSFHSLMSAVESNAKSKFRFYFQFLVCWANIWN